jgi:phosphoglycolate phosphatase-like HAD superfamily hydrolase
VTGVTPAVLALDFDGVVCDGRAEYFEAARRAREVTWPGANVPPHAAVRFAALRPLVESGWEMPLLLHAVAAGVAEAAVADRASWMRTANAMLAQTGFTPETLGRTLNDVRDQWFARNPEEWVAHHVMYEGVPERIEAALDDGVRVVIVTTKSERFARALLVAHSARLAALTVVGREPGRAPAKVDTLASLAQDHSLKHGAGLWFVEDFLDTLHSVRRAVGLGAVRLFLADWGYNTVQDRARVQRAPGISLLSLARFIAPFSEWPPPQAAPAGT